MTNLFSITDTHRDFVKYDLQRSSEKSNNPKFHNQFFMTETQTQIPIRSEAEEILFETNRLRAEKLVEDLNNGFFESVASGLTEGQRMIFEFPDGSKQIVTPNCSHRIGSESVDFFLDEG